MMTIILFLVAAFVAPNKVSALRLSAPTLLTKSGLPVCRYALGGAARSHQTSSLPLKYSDLLLGNEEHCGAPFYFYYNPHRYPDFIKGVVDSFSGENAKRKRADVFIASGGTDRSLSSLDKRLEDARRHSGSYLDCFVLEYVCPDELDGDGKLGRELQDAIRHAQRFVEQGKVRYLAASTHSHEVGRSLSLTDDFDALMLRYNMSHRKAAESLSLPAAQERGTPVIAFTTTRWNRLQEESPAEMTPPTTSDCLKFALQNEAIEIVLHSARDEDELDDSLLPLFESTTKNRWVSGEEYSRWVSYGSDEKGWNIDDDFDEYPHEMDFT